MKLQLFIPALLLLSCTTEPETKKASFVLKEACKDDVIHWNPSPVPSWWKAYIVQGTNKTPFEVSYRDGFTFDCPINREGSIEVYYQN